MTGINLGSRKFLLQPLQAAEVAVIGKISIPFNPNMTVIANFFRFVSKCLLANMTVSSHLKFFFCFCIHDERFRIAEDVFDIIFLLQQILQKVFDYIFSRFSSVYNRWFSVIRICTHDLVCIAARVKIGLVCSTGCLRIWDAGIYFLYYCFKIAVNFQTFICYLCPRLGILPSDN